ncbi:hypothetical protein L0152_02925 [bacterium]|nr:hypothetical protein [bacterium]
MPEETTVQKHNRWFSTFLVAFFIVIGLFLLIKWTSKDEKTYSGPCAREEAYGDQTGNYTAYHKCIELERAKPDPPEQQYP